ncbi:endothelin-converting enzyme homolog [Gordionus sp. m RMFG-2023]|uniref:endothelin-converting enzyme homolog n=1 Tax=Gordionus sp. m RMFG-2023 TaxID=3053472 RepID=UPI0031FD8801
MSIKFKCLTLTFILVQFSYLESNDWTPNKKKDKFFNPSIIKREDIDVDGEFGRSNPSRTEKYIRSDKFAKRSSDLIYNRIDEDANKNIKNAIQNASSLKRRSIDNSSNKIVLEKENLEVIRLKNVISKGILILTNDVSDKETNSSNSIESEQDISNVDEGAKEEKMDNKKSEYFTANKSLSDEKVVNKSHNDEIENCMSPNCISISARLLNSMNLSVDPCDDFYNYACGGWINDNNIPDGSSSWSHFQALYQKNQYILRKILETKNKTFDSTAEEKARIYYESCLDQDDVIESLGGDPILNLLDKYGGWNFSVLKTPLKSSEDNVTEIDDEKDEDLLLAKMLPREWDFQEKMERLTVDFDLGLIFSVYITDDDKNSTQNALFIDIGSTSLPDSDFYFNVTTIENLEILTAYLKYMINVGSLLESKIERRRLLSELEEKRRLSKSRAKRLLEIKRKEEEKKKKLSAHPPESSSILEGDKPVLRRRVENVHTVFERLMKRKVRQENSYLDSSDIVGNGDTKNGSFRKSAYLNYFRLLTKSMANILAFEGRIANFTPSSESLKDIEKYYNPMTLKEIDQKYDFMNWTTYLNKLFGLVNLTLTSDQIVIVRSTDYFANLTLLIKEYLSSAEKRTILNNYFMWHVTKKMLPYLSSEFRATLRPLSKAIKGSTDGVDTWKACLSDTNSIIGFPLGSLYIKEEFQGRDKTLVNTMIDSIKVSFKKQLTGVDWMDEDTKKVAAEKVDAVKNKIGFPEYLLDSKLLDEKYEGLEFSVDDYFGNNLRQIPFYVRKALRKLKLPVDKSRWSLTPHTVNAYYSASANEMVFPAGILQSPFYDSNFPKSLNFGAMGFIVGHELTHGFDDTGRQFDINGNLRSWWNETSVKNFNEKAECLKDQYSNFTLARLKINGEQTLGENIADNGGLKATFSAFQSFKSSNPMDTTILPGLNMTDDQLFFLSFAQVWCSVDSRKSLFFEILKDSHSPNKIRVLGTLSNSVEFSNAYNCAAKSPMNPDNKCSVW